MSFQFISGVSCCVTLFCGVMSFHLKCLFPNSPPSKESSADTHTPQLIKSKYLDQLIVIRDSMDFLLGHVHVLIRITKVLKSGANIQVLFLSFISPPLFLYSSTVRACPPPIPHIVFLFHFMTCTLELIEVKIPELFLEITTLSSFSESSFITKESPDACSNLASFSLSKNIVKFLMSKHIHLILTFMMGLLSLTPHIFWLSFLVSLLCSS